MKNHRNILSLMVFAMLFFAACKQTDLNKESTFWVRGNCEMCKERIEDTLRRQIGVGRVVWDVETKMITVNYDSNLVKEIDLHKAIAAKGHATKLIPMDQAAHASLPECCQIDGEHAEQAPADSVVGCCQEAGHCSTNKDKCCSKEGKCTKDNKDCNDAEGSCAKEKGACCKVDVQDACCSVNGTCTTKAGKVCCNDKGVCQKDGQSCDKEEGACRKSKGTCCS